MSKRFLLILLAFPFLLNQCKDDEIISVRFNLNYESDFTVQSGTLVDVPINILTPDITTNSEAQFSANNTHKDKVSELKLNYLKLAIQNPPNKTFSFLKHIYIFINAPGQEETRLAYKENIQNSATEIDLIVEDRDFLPYIKEDRFSLRIETVTDELLGEDVDIRANLQFNVKAVLL